MCAKSLDDHVAMRAWLLALSTDAHSVQNLCPAHLCPHERHVHEGVVDVTPAPARGGRQQGGGGGWRAPHVAQAGVLLRQQAVHEVDARPSHRLHDRVLQPARPSHTPGKYVVNGNHPIRKVSGPTRKLVVRTSTKLKLK